MQMVLPSACSVYHILLGIKTIYNAAQDTPYCYFSHLLDSSSQNLSIRGYFSR